MCVLKPKSFVRSKWQCGRETKETKKGRQHERERETKKGKQNETIAVIETGAREQESKRKRSVEKTERLRKE